MELLLLFAVGLAVLAVAGFVVVKLLIFLVLVPFKLLGLLFKVVFGIFSVIAAVLLGLAFVVLLPLLPFLLLAGVVWLIVRASSRPSVPRLTA